MLPIRLSRGDSRTAANKQIIFWAAARFSWICPGPSQICSYSAPGRSLGGNETLHFLTTLGSEFRESLCAWAASASQKRQIRPWCESSQGNSCPAAPVCASESANGGARVQPQGRSSLRMDVARLIKFVLVRRFPGMQKAQNPKPKLRLRRKFLRRNFGPDPSHPFKKIRPLPGIATGHVGLW